MKAKKILQELVVAVYIAMTLAGFSYTMFRYWLPGVPRVLAVFDYGMMAPFQGYRTFNDELVAEGRTAGDEWQTINLQPYYPFNRGETSFRMHLVSFRYENPDVPSQKYRELARILKQLEAQAGREWQSVRLHMEKWPKSPAGYYYLRTPLFTDSLFLVQVP